MIYGYTYFANNLNTILHHFANDNVLNGKSDLAPASVNWPTDNLLCTNDENSLVESENQTRLDGFAFQFRF